MVIGALMHANGSHAASWLMDEARPHASTDIDYYREMAQLAERGKFDFFFIADTPAARTENLRAWSRSPLFMNVPEPITLLPAIAGATTHIGLGATASTSFYEPYNVARLFSPLDHISHGRAAWNVVTSANDYAARNFGSRTAASRTPTATPRRRSSSKSSKHSGTPGKTAPSSTTRRPARASCPRSSIWSTTRASTSPCMARSTSSVRRRAARSSSRPAHPTPAGISAAEHAEVVFGSSGNLDAAKAFYSDLEGSDGQVRPSAGRPEDRLGHFGRDRRYRAGGPRQARPLAGPGPSRRRRSAPWTGPRNRPVGSAASTSRCRSPDSATSNLHKAYFDEIAGLIRQGLTLREIARRFNRAKATFCGTATQVADHHGSLDRRRAPATAS